VIGLGEAAMLFGCSLARTIGLVTIDPVFVPWHEAQIARHGLERRVIGVTAIRADLPRFMRAFTDPAEHDAVCADFAAQVRPLIDRGVDLLIPAGGLPMLLFAEGRGFAVDGVPVLDGIATVLKVAEMAVAMHRITGIAASRAGLFARAAVEAVADFRGATRIVP
jgi:Asp/Glu/hydantoin racemase